ncbi:cysteine peptidase family C39 domain-containing protein [Embleya sp. NPDC056575]|uniref:cysteine peptidase family C39 domain-containing protein n=1 Tax=unclassified Embleya TaxID=2699296 RepID=UPI0036974C87
MFAYVGSGPYCYSSSLAMVLGADAPSLAVIETLTGSPFGCQLIGGVVPLFDPYGWDPDRGVDDAIALLGWSRTRVAGGTPTEAVARLRAACARGPVLVGPVDMGLLHYQPETRGAFVQGSGVASPGIGDDIGGDLGVADHYVVVLEVTDDTVLLHDPHGHPYATLPTDRFAASWQAEKITYTDEPFVMRTDFVRHEQVAPAEALRRSLAAAVGWSGGREDLPMPAGSLAGGAALERLAAQVDAGLAAQVRVLLEVFAIRVGVRRLVDAATCLAGIGRTEAASIASDQARILGGLQYPLVIGDDRALAAGFRRLAPTYGRLHGVLAASLP